MRPRERYSPAQCRAARGLLDWRPDRLAIEAGLEVEAIDDFEAGEGLAENELAAIGAAFARAGLVAIPQNLAGEGVRFAKRNVLAADVDRADPWPPSRTPFADGPGWDDIELEDE